MTSHAADQDGAVSDAPAGSDPPPPRGLHGARLLTLRLAVIAGLVGLWQLSSGWLVDAFFIGEPVLVAVRLWDWFSTGFIYEHLVVTLYEAALGFALGASSGIVVGYLFGRNQTIALIFDPILSALNALPKLALAPLFVVWFGIGVPMKMWMGAVIVFFLVVYNTYHGVRDADRDLQDALRVFGADRRDILRRVILPSSLPVIYVGLRIAVPFSLVGAVVGEIVAANRGLGWLITYAAGQFDTNAVFAGLFVLMVVAVVLNELLSVIERHTLRWKPSTAR